MSLAPVCTVIVSPRDRFSTLEKCVTNVFNQTTQPIEVILVSGGTPPKIEAALRQRFDGRATLIFRDHFLTGPEARNIALRQTKTELAACIDSDVFVRPGWLPPLLHCQQETGAALISPVILDRQNLIHTAGNRLYITESEGKKYGMAELHYANLPWCGPSNIPRFAMDYAEVHCHFVQVKKALSLGIYDDHFREGTDFDSGMVLRKHGEKIYQEPASQAYLYYPPVLDDLVDRDLYLWKWDVEAVMENFRYFEKKWGIDLLAHSNMRNHIIMLNHRVGLMTRLVPNELSVKMDVGFFGLKSSLSGASTFWRSIKNKTLGYN